MLNRLKVILIMAYGTILLSSCNIFAVEADGEVVTETRDIIGFTGIEVNGSADVEVHTGDSFKVEVTCEQSILDILETELQGNTLRIRFSRPVRDVDVLKIVVTAPSWSEFTISGSANLNVLDAISGNSLDLDISGSGNLNVFEAQYASINSRISGSGNVDIAGNSDRHEMDVTGSGKIDALDCETEEADIDISGSGDVFITATDKLRVEITGSGSVRYLGNPDITSQITGSGSLIKL